MFIFYILLYSIFFSRPVLSVNSQPYFSVQQPHLNQPQNSGNTSGNSTSSNVDRLAPMPHWEPEREALGERLLVKVQAMKPVYSFFSLSNA